MELKYKNLLSPIQINSVVLRNRLFATPSNPHFVQGPEKWPTEALITHYANKAKSGAAVVTCKGNNPVKTKDEHSQSLDITVGSHQHYFAQVAEAVHYYGARASYLVLPNMNIVEGFDASDGVLSEYVQGDGSRPEYGRAAPRELLLEMAEEYGREARLAKSLGFDMCYMHMAYRLMFPGRFLSPLSNRRTDEFGGSVENRARFPLMICKRIKELCGKDFLIEVSISGREDDLLPGGLTVEDQIAFAELAQGLIDILQIRGGSIDPSQPTYLDLRKIPQLDTAAAIRRGIRERGVNMLVNVVGGCQDLDACEGIIAGGRADIVGAARSWIADPRWGVKAYEGRNEDVIPCLRCNKCHIPGPERWHTACSVNPEWGLEHKLERMAKPPERSKKLAVVGGGPAGMEFALLAKRRGHNVTLYEKAPALGGLLNAVRGIDIKWTVADFRDHMAGQIEKSGVRVLLNTAATPGMMDAEGYDEVVLALGSEPVYPPIPGIRGETVCHATQAVAKEPEMGENVVVIGGGDIGVEISLHLARKGHKVTIIEMLDRLAPESVPVHFRSMLEQMWETEPNLRYILNARVTGIAPDAVTYADKAGTEREVRADHVVVAAGMRSQNAGALPFFTGKARVHMIGDCERVGSIQTAMRSAYGLAMNI